MVLMLKQIHICSTLFVYHLIKKEWLHYKTKKPIRKLKKFHQCFLHQMINLSKRKNLQVIQNKKKKIYENKNPLKWKREIRILILVCQLLQVKRRDLKQWKNQGYRKNLKKRIKINKKMKKMISKKLKILSKKQMMKIMMMI